MSTYHKLIFGNCMEMSEINDATIHLIVTSPPYYNAPFDYKGLFSNYNQYLGVLNHFAKESFRVLKEGRIVALNIDDMLVDGVKYPIVADATQIFQNAGFRYRDRIIWKKPDGYLRISKRSGVILQNPYPMYYYPDNLLESILIFQKGKFDYHSISKEVRELSKIDIREFQKNNWHKTLWEMTNVLPGSNLEKNIAAFPEELPFRIIKLYSYIGETVLDPFLGSGTTMKVARQLKRNSVGIEIIKDLEKIIIEKIGFKSTDNIEADQLEIIERNTGKYKFVTLEYIEKLKSQQYK
ncbi:MAG TPA: site-specific DNA-methyltransferase [Paludibacteraceae bacterium]|nr:site-specific DNA-methyltransferase [Paludibacteraceae bacterium]